MLIRMKLQCFVGFKSGHSMWITTVYGKTLEGETFGTKYTIHWKTCGASGRSHHVLYTANDSRGKLS